MNMQPGGGRNGAGNRGGNPRGRTRGPRARRLRAAGLLPSGRGAPRSGRGTLLCRAPCASKLRQLLPAQVCQLQRQHLASAVQQAVQIEYHRRSLAAASAAPTATTARARARAAARSAADNVNACYAACLIAVAVVGERRQHTLHAVARAPDRRGPPLAPLRGPPLGHLQPAAAPLAACCGRGARCRRCAKCMPGTGRRAQVCRCTRAAGGGAASCQGATAGRCCARRPPVQLLHGMRRRRRPRARQRLPPQLRRGPGCAAQGGGRAARGAAAVRAACVAAAAPCCRVRKLDGSWPVRPCHVRAHMPGCCGRCERTHRLSAGRRLAPRCGSLKAVPLGGMQLNRRFSVTRLRVWCCPVALRPDRGARCGPGVLETATYAPTPARALHTYLQDKDGTICSLERAPHAPVPIRRRACATQLSSLHGATQRRWPCGAKHDSPAHAAHAGRTRRDCSAQSQGGGTDLGPHGPQSSPAAMTTQRRQRPSASPEDPGPGRTHADVWCCETC